MQIFFMVNKLELLDFEFDIANRITTEVFWVLKQWKSIAEGD